MGDAVDRQVCNPRQHGEAEARAMRWNAHRRARRAELVEAAVRAVTRCGPHVGMDEIAAEAGVTKPVLYRQFTDKSDLHVAVGQRAAAALLVALESELAVDRDPWARTAALVDVFLRTIEASPQVYRFVVARPQAEGRLSAPEPAQDYVSVIAARLAALLRDAMRERGRDSSGAEAWARGLVGMVQATGEWWLERRTVSRAALVEQLTGLIWSGLAGLLDGTARPPDRAHALAAPAGDGGAEGVGGAAAGGRPGLPAARRSRQS